MYFLDGILLSPKCKINYNNIQHIVCWNASNKTQHATIIILIHAFNIIMSRVYMLTWLSCMWVYIGNKSNVSINLLYADTIYPMHVGRRRKPQCNSYSDTFLNCMFVQLRGQANRSFLQRKDVLVYCFIVSYVV